MTISYGPWPNDAFLLFFGFVPDSNPHDTAVLFEDLADLVGHALEGGGEGGEEVTDVLREMELRLPGGEYSRCHTPMPLLWPGEYTDLLSMCWTTMVGVAHSYVPGACDRCWFAAM